MPKRLKVIHVIGGGEYGGAEEHIVQLLSLLPAHGVQGKVVCFYEAGLSRALRELNIEVEVLSYGRFDVRLISGLRKVFQQERPDVIHTHGVKANFFARLAARRLRTIPMITTVHSLLRYDYVNQWSYLGATWMERVTRKRNNHFIAVSEAIRRVLLTEYIPEEQISVVRHGIDYARFADADGVLREELALPADAYLIGAVTRLVRNKGMDDLLRAMKKIVQTEPRAHLAIVGTGPEEEALQRLARELGLSKHVHFVGFRRDIPQCLHSLDCFVSASLSEGLGLNVLEAMAAGRPIVATGVGGILDIVEDGSNGILVEPSRPDDLAEAVLKLADDPMMAERLKAAASVTVQERFSLDSMSSGTVAVYERVLEGQYE